MYQTIALLEARLQDLERERLQIAKADTVPTSGLSQGLRQSAGDALISLGTWIKPRTRAKQFSMRSARLAGR